MTRTPPMQYSPAPVQRQETAGLAITAFVLALCGLLFPPLAIVGLILGIIALARGTPARTLAIGSIVIAPVALLVCMTMIGIMLPALGQARLEAQKVKSGVQLRVIGQALVLYAQDNRGWYPEAGADWEERLLRAGTVTPEVLEAPGAEPGMTSYFYIPGYRSRMDRDTIILYENWNLPWRGGNVFYDDGRVEYLDHAQYEALYQQLEQLRLRPRR
jgi:hypothetical protein